MRKRIIIIPVQQETSPSDLEWLNMEELAEVEITSEDSAHPIESALLPGGSGWRAASTGAQTIRLLFSYPQHVRRIWLKFDEPNLERTQEFVLRWSSDQGKSFRDIVRQQWNFSPLGASTETEDLHVELMPVTVLELLINPDIGGRNALASLAQLRIA
jgi:hypothetical protein